jgi:LPXTG-site transpeptidase (sortase) family protein
LKNYNAVFYLLNKLETGDEVWMDYLGKRYKYRVEGKEVISASDERYLKMLDGVPTKVEKSDGNTDAGKQTLVLQTCWPPGTTWKRLLVKAELVDKI